MRIVPGYGNIGFNFSPESEEFFWFPNVEGQFFSLRMESFLYQIGIKGTTFCPH